MGKFGKGEVTLTIPIPENSSLEEANNIARLMGFKDAESMLLKELERQVTVYHKNLGGDLWQ